MNIIEAHQLNIGYDKKILMEAVEAFVSEGEIVTLVGPNGAGKTTLLKTISGLLPKIDGIINIQGRELGTISDNERAKIMSVMSTQKRNFDYVSCQDVIRVGRFPYTGMMGQLSPLDEKIIEDVMKLVGVYELSEREFDKISDGQRQRVLLARALVQEPKLMILDEPTSFLDVGYKIEFMQVIKKLSRERGIGILMSLHELDLAAAVSDRIITINSNNQIDNIGKPYEILTKEYISKLFRIDSGSYSIESGFAFDEARESEQSINEFNTNSKTKYIMVQGTMSNAGKSLIVAGLCRIMKQDGYRVAPFKSQNMALNSYVTEDGLEMGRAQVMQAEAAGIKPDVHMNPILLKPTDDQGSQVIVNGEVRCNMRAREYFEYKTSLIHDIKKSLEYLQERYDVIVIEGAGSPAEINLKKNDIVNMGMAKLVDAPVLLVGDIDRGGVFAQLLGTLELLEPEEKELVKGLIVNKFRGDKTILDSGIDMIERRVKKPVVGVLPYMDVTLEDEDSLTERFERKACGVIDIAVIRLPHISNFTDFDVFEQSKQISVRYVRNCKDIENADMVIIPGSKNTIADMRWLKENGFEIALGKANKSNIPIWGICGGYQMLGKKISDPYGVESGGIIDGLSFLQEETILSNEKCRRQVEGKLPEMSGTFEELSGCAYYGYEIHMGQTENSQKVISQNGNIYGTYIHGIFDSQEIASGIIKCLSKRKNVDLPTDTILDYRTFKEKEYDKLAKIMREHLNMDEIYSMMERGNS